MHPGIISETELGRNVPHEDLVKYGVFDENGKIVNDPSRGLKSLLQGASTTVWCATSPQLKGIGGVYCENADIAQLDNSQITSLNESLDGSAVMKDVMPYALDEEAAKKLWKLSEDLTGLRFSI